MTVHVIIIKEYGMLSKLLNLLLLFFIIIFAESCEACDFEYRIRNNGESFDKQLYGIIAEINSIPGTENITIRMDEGYYAIAKTIEINECKHRLQLIGSKSKPTIISGSIEVKGWEIMPNGIWRGHVPIVEDINYLPDQLFVNGVRAVKSRTPNTGFFVIEDCVSRIDSLYEVVLSKEDIDDIYWSDDEIPILTICHNWNSSKRLLNKKSISTNAFCFWGKEFPSCNKLKKGNRLIIENTKRGMDVPGEWCVDKEGVIYYLPKNGEKIEETEFRIPIVEKLLSIQSIEGLSIKNIVFEHTSFQIPAEGVSYEQAASAMSAAIEIDNANRLLIDNCEIHDVANYGIWLRNHCSNSSVSKTYFHDLGAGALKIGTIAKVDSKSLTNNIIVENNVVQYYGQLFEEAAAIILFNASGCTIKHNDVHYGNYTGISLGWKWGFGESLSKNNEVSYNRVSHVGSGLLNDLGGIYTLGRSEGTHIHHNVISNVLSGANNGWGIYADEGTTGVVVEKNLVYNTTSGGFYQHYGSDNIVSNNIFAWGEKSQFYFALSKGEKPLFFIHNIVYMRSGKLLTGSAINSDKFIVGHNCYWSVSDELPTVSNENVYKWIEKTDSTSVYQNPQFRDPENNDFRFKKKDICKVIGFEPFDYTQAGVYGKKKWKKLADSCRE